MTDDTVPVRQPTVAEAQIMFRDHVRVNLAGLDQHDPLSDDDLAYIDHCFEHATRSDLVARTIGATRSVQNILLMKVKS